jgi:hypothetical protein
VQQTLEAYLYTGDDPVNETDPTGLVPRCQWWNIVCQIAQAADAIAQGGLGFLQGNSGPQACSDIGWQLTPFCGIGALLGLGMEVLGGDEGQVEQQLEERLQILRISGSMRTQWGWSGGPAFRAAVREVALGGDIPSIPRIGGKVPTLPEAVRLIEQGGGRIVRIDDIGHKPPNPHQESHINYLTKLARRGMLVFRN